jgi:phage baseplate assembly protein W
MARSIRVFSDLDFNFTVHPVTKDIVRRYDENAIKASVRHLLLTKNYERPFHSEIGSPIRALMFEPATPLLEVSLRRAVIDTITNFEPRVEIIDVQVLDQSENNAVNITLIFKIVNTSRPIQLDLVLERTR